MESCGSWQVRDPATLGWLTREGRGFDSARVAKEGGKNQNKKKSGTDRETRRNQWPSRAERCFSKGRKEMTHYKRRRYALCFLTAISEPVKFRGPDKREFSARSDGGDSCRA